MDYFGITGGSVLFNLNIKKGSNFNLLMVISVI